MPLHPCAERNTLPLAHKAQGCRAPETIPPLYISTSTAFAACWQRMRFEATKTISHAGRQFGHISRPQHAFSPAPDAAFPSFPVKPQRLFAQ